MEGTGYIIASSKCFLWLVARLVPTGGLFYATFTM